MKHMRKSRFWSYGVVALLGVFVSGVYLSTQVMAQTSSSENYQITETQFGGGSSIESCSDEYCARSSVGDQGRSSSGSSAELGEAEYTEPLIEIRVTSDASDLGNLSTEHTAYKTMRIQVRNYVTGGYMLQIVGNPPKYEGRSIAALSVPTVSTPGKEQFGINVVKNTTPAVGENPLLQPSEESALSLIKEDYRIPNKFKYADGDVIALSQQDTGGADYTVSMILNISSSTPAGRYSGDFAAVVIPAY